jgi:hypothetical protein
MKKIAALLALGAIAMTPPHVAQATPLFVGTYTAVQESSMPASSPTDTPVAQPNQNGIWIVQSSCLTLGCIAHVVISKALTDFDMMFDGTKWDRLAVPQIATCNGATVPALSAHESLVPQANGSLTGALTSTVDCNGASIDQSQPLRVTPS